MGTPFTCKTFNQFQQKAASLQATAFSLETAFEQKAKTLEAKAAAIITV